MQRLIIRLTAVALMVVSGVAVIITSQRAPDAVSGDDAELNSGLSLPDRPPARAAIPISETSFVDPLASAPNVDPAHPNDGVFERIGDTTTEYVGQRPPPEPSLAAASAQPRSSIMNLRSTGGATASLGDQASEARAVAQPPSSEYEYGGSSQPAPYTDPYAGNPAGDAPPPSTFSGRSTESFSAPAQTAAAADGAATLLAQQSDDNIGQPPPVSEPAAAPNSVYGGSETVMIPEPKPNTSTPGNDPYASPADVPADPLAGVYSGQTSPSPSAGADPPPTGAMTDPLADVYGAPPPAADPAQSAGAYAAPPGPGAYAVDPIHDAAAPGAYGPPAAGSVAPLSAAPRSTTDFVGDTSPSGGAPATSASALPPATFSALAVPGDAELEGRQTPTITIDRRAPTEVQVGRPATFTMVVRNEGRVTARDVMVVDRVPQGTRFLRASPEFTRAGDSALVWNLGELTPGQSREVTMEVVPEQEGEIGSVARLVFQSAASARTISTRPELVLKQTGPEKVLIGDAVTITISISNPGTGAASNVVLEADIPAGLRHPRGPELEYPVGVLPPGATRTLQLTLTADKGGVVTQRLAVRGDGDLYKQESMDIQITAPELELSVDGPSKRYVDRNARYVIQLANPGTAAARDVELVAVLPRGMKFVSTNNHGEYDARTHSVFWSLIELPPDNADALELVTIPVETGEHRLRVEGKGALGVAAVQEHVTNVFTLNELSFTVADAADPIEVGSDTSYEIRVTNLGSRPDTSIRVVVELPPGMDALPASGSAPYSIEQQQVVFEAIPRLDSGATATLTFGARGVAAGDHRVRVKLSSQDSPTPVVKEEATRVYLDR